MNDKSFFLEMANQTADQAFLLLGLDRVSTENLINEVKAESNLKVKYSKLLHILINRLTLMNQNRCNFPEECKECIQKVKDVFIQNDYIQKRDIDFIPSKPKDFLRWIPDQFELFTSTILKFRSKVDNSQKKLDHIITLNKAKDSRNKSDNDDEKEKLKQKINLLKQKIEKLKSENNFLKQNQIKFQSKKTIECDSELETLKKKYALISSQVVDLQQQVSKAPFKVRLLTKKLEESENTNKELLQINEKLKHDLRMKTEDLDQEKLNNVSREKKFNEIKEKLSNYANDLMKKEKDLNDTEARDNTLQNLRLQLKTLADHLSSTEKERDELKNELERASAQNLKYNSENDTLKAQCTILQNDNISIRKENQSLLKKIDSYEAEGIKISGQIQQNDLKIFSAESQLKDFKNECNNLKEKLKSLQETICKQNKEIVSLETQLTKTRDLLHSTTNKLKNSGNCSDDLSLQKVGFLLADALNQNYNPKNTRSEIERLIEVAHLEHIKLSETGRVKLNPFDCPVLSNTNSFKSNNADQAPNYNIHSKFDEFNKELSTFSMRQFDKV